MWSRYRFLSIVLTGVLVVGAWMGPQAPVQARPMGTNVGGPIISNTTWTAANSPYIVTANLNVLTGVTLTIQSGVTVRFGTGYKLLVNGQLQVLGTSNNPVRLTSNQPIPHPGDWDKIEFAATAITTTTDANGGYVSGSLLRGCIVEYGGSAGDQAVTLRGILMESCTVQYSPNFGVSAPYLSSGTPSWVVSSTIQYNTGGGVYLDHSVIQDSIVQTNTSHTFMQAGVTAVNHSLVLNTLIQGNLENGTMDATVASGALLFDSTALSNTVRGNQSLHGIGPTLRATGVSGTHYTVVAYNRIESNSGQCTAYLDQFLSFENNQVLNNTNAQDAGVGGGLCAYNGGLIRYNLIAGNQLTGRNATGSGAYLNAGWEALTFEYNTVTGNRSTPAPGELTAGLALRSAGDDVHFNTIFGNDGYEVTVYGAASISGTQNYFGTTDTTGLLDRIYDFYDNSALGEFIFIPYRSNPDPAAPFGPPAGLSAQPLADGRIRITWQALPGATTGWGYKVYYGASNRSPWQGTGQPGGASPLDVGAAVSVTLTSPLPAYVTVTGYDTDGHESDYGTILDLTHIWRLHLPLIQK